MRLDSFHPPNRRARSRASPPREDHLCEFEPRPSIIKSYFTNDVPTIERDHQFSSISSNCQYPSNYDRQSVISPPSWYDRNLYCSNQPIRKRTRNEYYHVSNRRTPSRPLSPYKTSLRSYYRDRYETNKRRRDSRENDQIRRTQRVRHPCSSSSSTQNSPHNRRLSSSLSPMFPGRHHDHDHDHNDNHEHNYPSPGWHHQFNRDRERRHNYYKTTGPSYRNVNRNLYDYDTLNNYHQRFNQYSNKRRCLHDDDDSYDRTSYYKRDRRDREKHKRAEKRRNYDESCLIWKDKVGHLCFTGTPSLSSNYKVLSVVGEGTFGKVLKCWDRNEKEYVAVKVVRAVEKYVDAAMIEIDVLEHLKKKDPHHKNLCIHLQDWFSYRSHICMVFPLYGCSLYQFLKENHYKPFPLSQIKDFSKQIFKSLAFLHELTLIHTDLKPENVLLVNSDYTIKSGEGKSEYRVLKKTNIRIIDFGSATYQDEYHTSVVSTRHYRAPEVILGMGWSYPCDIWSVGCILIELYTGEALFQTHYNAEHLAMMEKIIQPFPESFTSQIRSSLSERGKKYFSENKLRWPELADHGETKHVDQLVPLRDLISKQDSDFLDLICKLLDYHPETRMTAKGALSHPFLSEF